MLDPAQKLEYARTEAGRVRLELRQLERQMAAHQRQNRLLAEKLTEVQTKLGALPGWLTRLFGA